MRELAAGSVFAGHRIDTVVGRGGMGVVYRATQLDLDRTVALKVVAPELLSEDGPRERFLQESKLAASIEHPHVIPIYYAGEEDGLPYLAMRFVAGDDARALVRREGPLPPERAAGIVAQVAGALDAAHAAGLVHRDVKPANVLLGPDDHAYLSDFGLSRRVRSISGMTATGQWVGTLDYVAPEQIRGERVDARVDVYALGCVLYYLLTAEIPFPREGDEAKLWAHLTEPPPRPSERGAPAAFDEVIRRALAKSPDERYPSAGDLGRAAEAAAADRSVEQPERAVATGGAAPSETPTRTSPHAETVTRRRGSGMPRRRILVAAAALIAIAAAVVIAVVLSSDDEPVPHEPSAPVAAATPAGPPRVVATVRYGSRPNAVVPTGQRVWVGAWRTDHLAAIDTTANKTVPGMEPATDEGTVDMVRTGTTLWVATRAREILQLDARTGKQLAPAIPVPMDPTALAVHGTDLYVGQDIDQATPQILRIDTRSRAVLTTKVVSPNTTGMLYTRGRLWSLHGGPNHIVGRDPKTLQAVRDVPLPGGSVGALAVGDGALWATIPDQDQLVRYSLRRGSRATVSVGARPIGLAVRGKRVWIAASGTSTLERVTTSGMRHVGAPIRVPLNPLAVAVTADAAWVTCAGVGVVARVAI